MKTVLLTIAQIIDDGDIMWLGEKALPENRAERPYTTSNENAHHWNMMERYKMKQITLQSRSRAYVAEILAPCKKIIRPVLALNAGLPHCNRDTGEFSGDFSSRLPAAIRVFINLIKTWNNKFVEAQDRLTGFLETSRIFTNRDRLDCAKEHCINKKGPSICRSNVGLGLTIVATAS
jgi:hypothetical protein